LLAIARLKLLNLPLQITFIDALQNGFQGSFEPLEDRCHEAGSHASSSSKRNFLPPVFAIIVSS